MKISVVICVRNRKDDLFKSLAEFYKQDYDNFEIIVIDNQSTDGTKEEINNYFPEVKYTYLPMNINILAQNIGVYQATGEIIWRTDSDSYPESYKTFSKIVEIFKKNSNIHIITTTEVLVKSGYKEIKLISFKSKEDNNECGYKVLSFSGPGSAILKVVFDKIGYYWEFGMEENDFSIRALRAGFNIRYFPEFRTLHFTSQFDRNKNERWLKITNQNIRLIVKFYPLSRLYNIIFCYLNSLLEGILKRVSFSVFFQNTLAMIVTIINTWRLERVPLSNKEFKLYVKDNEYYKGFVSYLMNKIK